MTERVTTRFPDDIMADVDELVEHGEFKNRSDAIRAGVKSLSGVDEPDEPVNAQWQSWGRS